MNITFTERSVLIFTAVVSFWRSMSIVSVPILSFPRTMSKTQWILVAAAGLLAPAGTTGNARRVRERAIVRIMTTGFLRIACYTTHERAGNETERTRCLLHAGCEKGAASPYALESLYSCVLVVGSVDANLLVRWPSVAFIA